MRPNQHVQLTGQPLDSEGPFFREPWEASAFAMVVKLNEAGYFSWSEWVEYLAKEIKAADNEHDHDKIDVHDDSAHDYYHHWFAALEKLIVDKKIVDQKTITGRHQYLKDNPVPHDHVARREPIKIA